VTLAWPIVGLNVLNVLALAVDTAMCGRLENSENALAALSYSTQVIFLLMVAMLGLTVGTVATVARAHGARHDERVNHVLVQSSQLTVMLAIAIAVIGNILAPQILTLLGATEATLQLGRRQWVHLAALAKLVMSTACVPVHLITYSWASRMCRQEARPHWNPSSTWSLVRTVTPTL